MRVAIVGAGGFVGAALCRHLRTHHPEIGTDALLRQDFDLADESSWSSLRNGIDCVVHCAGALSGTTYGLFRVNALSAAAFARHCNSVGVKKLILLSTGAVYGPGQRPAMPQTVCQPQGDYAISKYVGELEMRREFAGHINVLRLYFPYGAGQAESRFIPRLVEKIRSGAAVKCRADGGPKINPTYVEDVVDVINSHFILRDSPIEVVNIASGEILSVTEIATALAQSLGQPLSFEPDGEAPDTLSVPYEQYEWRKFSPEHVLGA